MSAGSSKKQESSRKTSTSALLSTPKPLTVYITTNCGKFFKRWEYQTAWPFSCEICMQVKKQQLEPDMEQQIGSKLAKEYVKAIYCHPVYLTYMQSTSCEMPGLIKHKLESRLLREISITSDMQMILPLWQKARRIKEPLDESERREWKSRLRTEHSEDMASGPITSCQIDGETMETVRDFTFCWAPKSLQVVTAAMKLKDACSLEEKLWPT